jgi:hypothetical protein
MTCEADEQFSLSIPTVTPGSLATAVANAG